MYLESHTPMCTTCAAQTYFAALQQFTCKECGTITTALHIGNWHYCDKCATKLGKCTLCGENM